MSDVGAGWLAAVIAPWAVSPHPNFSEVEVSPFRTLALVTEGRADELERYAEVDAEGNEQWASDLISAAQNSLLASSQAPSVPLLWDLAMRRDIPNGARAASALFASFAQAELDDPEGAAEALGKLVADIIDWPDAVRQSNSTEALIVSALRLQRAVRLYESGSGNAAIQELKALENSIPRQRGAKFDSFAVSQGISWKSTRVQLDILRSLKSHSLALRSRLERFDGDTWVQVIRSRPTWVDLRTDWRSATRDREFVQESLTNLTRTRSGKVSFRRYEPSVHPGLAALTSAELSGDVNRIYSNRESLGLIRLLKPVDPNQSFDLVEAVRLLRQSNSKPGIEAVVELGRSSWPADVLRDSIIQILKRPTFPNRISEQEIILIHAGVDLLTEEEISEALSGIWAFLDDSTRNHRSWASRLQALKTAGRLASQGDAAQEMASRLLSYLREFESIDYSLSNTIESVTAEINWRLVQSTTREQWIAWARSIDEKSEATAASHEILRALSPGEADTKLEHLTGLDYVFALLGNSDESASPEQIANAQHFCITALQSIRDEARGPSRSFGGYDAADISVAYASKTDDEQVWDAVSQFLLDERVDRISKARALDRLSKIVELIPLKQISSLRLGWSALVNSPQSDRFFGGDDVSNVFPEAIRLGLQLGEGEFSSQLSAVTELAGNSNPKLRIEAAKTIPYVLEAERAAEWGQSLLLQLTRDIDSAVQSDAARSLAMIQTLRTELSDLVDSRLSSLLAERSIRLPLLTLHGFQALLTKKPGADISSHIEDIRNAEKNHLSRIVRGAATEALRLAGE